MLVSLFDTKEDYEYNASVAFSILISGSIGALVLHNN